MLKVLHVSVQNELFMYYFDCLSHLCHCAPSQILHGILAKILMTAKEAKRALCVFHRPLQKRERTGKEYGCFPFV